MKFAITLLLPVTLFFSGCAGYHMGAARPKFMGDIQTIAVEPVKNDTMEPRLEILAANTIIKQIQQDGTYKIAPKDTADAILTTTITKIERDPARGVRGNVIATREFNLILTMKFQVTRRVSGAVVESSATEGRTSFFVGNDVQQEERQALPLACENAAIRMVSQITEGW